MFGELFSVISVEDLPNRNCFGMIWSFFVCIRTEKQPKHKVFGRDIPRTSGRISGRTSWPKSFHPVARSAGNSSFFARTSLTRRRGRPRPEGASEKFTQENFGLIFSFSSVMADALTESPCHLVSIGNPCVAIPAAIYRSAFRARAGKCAPECFLGNFGHLPRSAPKSAF